MDGGKMQVHEVLGCRGVNRVTPWGLDPVQTDPRQRGHRLFYWGAVR